MMGINKLQSIPIGILNIINQNNAKSANISYEIYFILIRYGDDTLNHKTNKLRQIMNDKLIIQVNYAHKFLEIINIAFHITFS